MRSSVVMPSPRNGAVTSAFGRSATAACSHEGDAHVSCDVTRTCVTNPHWRGKVPRRFESYDKRTAPEKPDYRVRYADPLPEGRRAHRPDHDRPAGGAQLGRHGALQ